MKLFKKFRTDKTFRNNIIVGLIILVFILNSQENVKTQAISEDTCNSYNTLGVTLGDDLKGCLASGCIGKPLNWPIPDIQIGHTLIQCARTIIGISNIHCTNQVDIGSNFLANSQLDAMNACTTGNAAEIGSYCFTISKYTCVEGEKCKSWQKPFARIFSSIFKKTSSGMDCSTQAYLTLGGIIMIALAVI